MFLDAAEKRQGEKHGKDVKYVAPWIPSNSSLFFTSLRGHGVATEEEGKTCVLRSRRQEAFFCEKLQVHMMCRVVSSPHFRLPTKRQHSRGMRTSSNSAMNLMEEQAVSNQYKPHSVASTHAHMAHGT